MKNASANSVAFWLALVALLNLAALCKGASPQPSAFGGPTMGTAYRVKIADAPPALDVAQLQREIESLLATIDLQMSTYRDDSELSRFNNSPAGVWFPVSKATAEVIAAAREISEKTGGALDVTVGPLVRLWHFGLDKTPNRDAKKAIQPPSEASIAAAKSLVGYEKLAVRLEPTALRKEIDRLSVDLSSIAPGYAVDQMATLVANHGVRNFTVEIGGEVRSLGTRADGKPWRVAIERPLANRREMLRIVPLVDSAVATAGDYRKFFESGGRRYSHIIDAATGRPVDHPLVSVTVVAETCLAADGWDTPLLVLGPSKGFECAEKNGVAALFVSRDKLEEYIRTTTAWKTRFGDDGEQN